MLERLAAELAGSLLNLTAQRGIVNDFNERRKTRSEDLPTI
jgi:hypothetical protein